MTMLNTEQEIHQLINQFRSSITLPLLELNEKISQLACEHSETMAANKVPLGNWGFKERIKKINRFIPNKAASEMLLPTREILSVKKLSFNSG